MNQNLKTEIIQKLKDQETFTFEPASSNNTKIKSVYLRTSEKVKVKSFKYS